MITVYFLRDVPPGNQHLAGRQLLERIYGRRPEMRYGPFGKPYLADTEGFFNLSHSRTVVAAAAGSVEMGFDLEAPRKIRLRRFARPEEREIDLRTLWVVKESFVKFTGEGLRALRSASVTREEEGRFRVHGGGRAAIVQVFPFRNCLCALATERPERFQIKEWQYD